MFTNKELMQETEKLKKFAYKLTRNPHNAEDLLHNTIVRALDKKHLYQENTNLFSWSSKIMYNLFVSDFRRKTKFETQYDPEEYIRTQRIPANQEKKSEYRKVREAIDALPKEHREIIRLICMQGNKYKDVSEKLKIPIGTVRSRLSRARENLKRALETPHRMTPQPIKAA